MNTKSFVAVAILSTFAITGCAAGMDDANEPENEQADESPMMSGAPSATPGANCTELGGGRFDCANKQRRAGGYAGFTMLDNLSSWKNEKVSVKNTGSVKLTVASQQGMNVVKQQTDLAPGESVTLERIDGAAPFWSVLMLTDAPLGRARIHCEIGGAQAPAPEEAEAEAEAASEAAPQSASAASYGSANCEGKGDSLTCTNKQKRPFGFGGFVGVDNLDATKNEKVKYTNTGSTTFTVASVQGLNVIRQSTELAPGQSVILERIDEGVQYYGTLIFTDAATGTIRAKAEVLH